MDRLITIQLTNKQLAAVLVAVSDEASRIARDFPEGPGTEGYKPNLLSAHQALLGVLAAGRADPTDTGGAPS